MIGMCGWEIIKLHDNWIYSQGVNMVGSSKGCRQLQLIDARGVVKICLDKKRNLVIVRKDFSTKVKRISFLQRNKLDVMG